MCLFSNEIGMGDEREKVFEAEGGQGFLVVALVADHREGLGAGITDGLGHPVADLDHLAELDFPMEVGEGGNDHVETDGEVDTLRWRLAEIVGCR